MRALRITLVSFTLLTLIGCIAVYKAEVQQGNVVTQEMVDKLKPGMTKSQVRFVLGTPLITDPFHPERWDYIYIYKKNASAPAETRQFTVIFDGDALAKVEGEMAMPPSATATENAPGGGNMSQDPTTPSPTARAL